MGISSNQARFLALTSRQVDLEFRVQQICQRRLRLSSELENVATSYNNSISNRQLYAMNTNNSGISTLTVSNLTSLKDSNGNNYVLLAKDNANNYFAIGSDTTISTTTNIINKNATGAATSDSAIVMTVGSGGSAQGYTLANLGLPAGSSEQAILEAALRNGILSIASKADEFTQSYASISGTGTNSNASTSTQYEMKDWRTLPNIADELYAGDDVAAENKYDKTVSEINAQDKKLQLEQTSIEVEYKAVTSEKESVKKILDTNAQASFKYFS